MSEKKGYKQTNPHLICEKMNSVIFSKKVLYNKFGQILLKREYLDLSTTKFFRFISKGS